MRRGISEERELVHRLDALGFAVMRAPASGSSTKIDRPDILAGRRGLCLAFEVKSTNKGSLYMSRETMDQLVRFSEKFGARPVLAVKFKRRRRGWLLLNPQTLQRTRKGYKVTLKQALKIGSTLEALVTGNIAEYL